MSGQRGYNPYAPPSAQQHAADDDEFAATSYDQYAQPDTPTTPTSPSTGFDHPQHSSAYEPSSASSDEQPLAHPQHSYQSSQPTGSSVYEQPSRDAYAAHAYSAGAGNAFDAYGQPYDEQAAYSTQQRQHAEGEQSQAQQQHSQAQQQQQQLQLQQQQQSASRGPTSQATTSTPTTGAAAGHGDAYEMQDQSNSQFFNEVDDIKRNLVQYEDNIERIEGSHKRSLAESNIESEAAMQKQLDTSQADTRGLAEASKTRIKRLEATSQRDSTKSAQAQNSKHQFMTMIQKFQATEAAFRQRYRDVAARQYRIVDPDASEQQIQQAIDEDPSGQVFSQASMQSNRRGEARSALTEVQMRHREIQKIEATISELAQSFHDMEVMVAEQDQQVTHVEQNVYGAQTDIERGVDNQFAAIKKAKAWRKKKWWCVALIVVVVLFCISFFAIYFGGGYNH